MLEIKNVTIEYYGEVTQLNFGFNRGVTLILGEVGSYKTTLLRVIGGVKEISEGEILLDEKHIEELSPKERNMVLVGADTVPLGGNVNKMLMKPLVMRGINRREASLMAQKAALEFSLDINKKIAVLKKSELLSFFRARLSLRQTDVSMFDEPYHFLGEDSAVTAMIKSRSGHVLVTSCDGSDMNRLKPDWVVIVKRDKILQQGTAEQVLSCPVDKYVEMFLNV